MREVIGRRLNCLSQDCVQLLTLASIIGREFSLEELQCLVNAGLEESLLELLDESLAVRVIEAGFQAAGRYQFSHDFIRETLYDELPAA